MGKTHLYKPVVSWTGHRGVGTVGYAAYSRDHDIFVEGKPVIEGSSDPLFRGDKSKYSPEDLLVSSLAACHMLWYLHLCAVNDVVVIRYSDAAVGEMSENGDGSGQFTKVTLRPRVAVSEPGMIEKAKELHGDAHRMCFIARSVNFPMFHETEVTCYEKT